MIHIVESKAYKSDSDRSLRSYFNNLRERITKADYNVTELTAEISETLSYINQINILLEEFRDELVDDIEQIRPQLSEKKRNELNSTLDKIKEALLGNNIGDIAKEIEEASKCLVACQSCFTATYENCITADSSVCTTAYVTCTECVSEQAGCAFCDNNQSVCVTSDKPCNEEYSSACHSCYQSLYNTCQQEQLSCDYSAGCTNCQNNVSTCTNCQGNVGTCSNCYGGSYGECGTGQQSTCGERHAACQTNNEVQCSGCDSCQTKDSSCTRRVGCIIGIDVSCTEGWSTCKRADVSQTCETKYQNGNDIFCESNYSVDNGGNYHCEQLFTGGDTQCYIDFDQGNGVKDCDTSYKCGTNNDSCQGGYSTTNGETHCLSNFADTCASFYVNCGTGDDIGCALGYADCSSCYGTSFGCSGCYDVAYCSSCNTAQTSCNTCVKGETSCQTCVKGETGHQDDVCSNCYGGCQSIWDSRKDCFIGNYGAAPACTICNIGCQSCDSSCYSSQGCNDCGSSQGTWCNESCGSANCGTSNCGAGQCNQSGCSNCDDVSACVCSHVGSYGCNFPMHSS